MTKQVIITMFATIALMSCKNETKKPEVAETKVETKVEVKKTESVQDYQVGSEVPKELVCMVNNAFMWKPQIPVPVNGKTYYGCCEMCVGTLNNDQKARIGKDPYSNKPVDKTEAYIVLMDKDGKVDYFESKENYLSFIKKI
tara:strand:- start:1838 stop:2263 length:426 start_codon:yes stop_codon:yes gene_type:complete